MTDEILIKTTDKVSTMTQVVLSRRTRMVNKFIQHQGKEFRGFKADGISFISRGEHSGVGQHGEPGRGNWKGGSDFMRIKQHVKRKGNFIENLTVHSQRCTEAFASSLKRFHLL